ncbi:MAG: DUF6259 domain-containing protein [Planctomycetota bacterium]
MKWDFEKGSEGWVSPGEEGAIVVEPGRPDNHAYQIAAAKPHHTRLTLAGSEKTPDFLLKLRVKLIDWTGAEPTVYIYGRSGPGGFRALALGPDGGRALCYYGQEKSSVTVGTLAVGLKKGEWVHVAMACYGDYLFGKSWPEGAPEPRWQAEGPADGLASGVVALGVWTSPRTPSSATTLFDDAEFMPITEEVLKTWGVRPGPRPPLAAVDVPHGSGVFDLPDRMGIASELSAIAFDRETGEITNLIDRQTGQEFIARDVKEPLFSCMLTRPYETERLPLPSRDFRKCEVARKGDDLQLTFTDCPQADVQVSVTARTTTDGFIRLRIYLENRSDWCIASVSFPGMPAPAALGGKGEDDALLAPWHGGAVVSAPGSRGASHTAAYPGPAFAQFYALYDGTAGLYVGMEDPDGHCKQYRLRSGAGKFVSMDLTHRFPEVSGQGAALPYDIALRTFQGDWRDAAAIYKAWAVRQPWCAKKLSERDDIPQFLKDGAGIIITGIANPEGREKRFGKRMEKLPDLMDAYRAATGLKHMVFVPYGWENRGTWAGINYFPSIPSDEVWREVDQELRRRGHRLAFLTSGYWWVVKRQKTGAEPAFDDTADFERRKEMCVAEPDGSIAKVDWYDRVGEFGDWRGLSAMLCHGSPKAQTTMKDIFVNVARLGVPLVSFDQEIGGCQHTPCYSKTHGHPPGYGDWMWSDFRDVCAAILKEGKPVQAELGLFMENESELAIPYMATYWSRQFGEMMGGGRGVGLFSYLYHEYVTAIGAACVQGQGPLGTRPSAGLRCRILANNLTRGLIPGPFMHDVPLEGGSKWHQEVSAAYKSFCRPYAHFPEYLLLGKTVRPVEIECEEVEVYSSRQDPKGKADKTGKPAMAKVPHLIPAVTTGSFEAADGSVAAVVVNSTPEARKAVAVVLGEKETVVYTADRKEEKRSQEKRISLSLEPFGVRVLVIKGS